MCPKVRWLPGNTRQFVGRAWPTKRNLAPKVRDSPSQWPFQSEKWWKLTGGFFGGSSQPCQGIRPMTMSMICFFNAAWVTGSPLAIVMLKPPSRPAAWFQATIWSFPKLVRSALRRPSTRQPTLKDPLAAKTNKTRPCFQTPIFFPKKNRVVSIHVFPNSFFSPRFTRAFVVWNPGNPICHYGITKVQGTWP